MARRPRGPLPDWKACTTPQRGILADLVARYEQHREQHTLLVEHYLKQVTWRQLVDEFRLPPPPGLVA